MNLIKFRGIELGGGREKLDVTLEKPDVTLYGLIDLVICLFFFFPPLWLFFGVCVRLFAVVFAFILRTEFSLYQSVTLLNLQRFFFFKYSMFVLTPSSLPFLHPSPSSDLAEGSVCQSCHSCFEVG